jgi:hypothetical protein
LFRQAKVWKNLQSLLANSGAWNADCRHKNCVELAMRAAVVNPGATRRGEARSPTPLATVFLIITALGSGIALPIAGLVGPYSASSTAPIAAGSTEHHRRLPRFLTGMISSPKNWRMPTWQN